MYRRQFVSSALGLLANSVLSRARDSARPNIILIYADDLGYGDLGCYGSSLRTPNIDRLATEGVRFTSFCSASSVCSPARAGLLTGRYPARVGIPAVLGPGDPSGLAEGEITLAKTLQTANYKTAIFGKWHIGGQEPHLPLNHGFGEFVGVPYSHDMWPCPLMHGNEVIQRQIKPETLTPFFTDQAVNFVRRNAERPFFLYLPFTAPHIPLAPSASFKRRSPLGSYGDTMMELDWGVGEVLNVLEETGVKDNTLVCLSSDNGPWYQGSAGRLRGRKGEPYEGGFRVPFLARMPGRIPAGLVQDGFASALDLFPTFARMAGASLPANPLDGVDISSLLTGESSTVARDPFLYFDYHNLLCARLGRHKLHLSRYNSRAWSPAPASGRVCLPLPTPELYDVAEDPSEAYDLSAEFPDRVTEIRERVESLLTTLPPAVQWTYSNTMALKVESTPAGALPVPKQ